jgi:hypothetical protein
MRRYHGVIAGPQGLPQLAETLAIFIFQRVHRASEDFP